MDPFQPQDNKQIDLEQESPIHTPNREIIQSNQCVPLLDIPKHASSLRSSEIHLISRKKLESQTSNGGLINQELEQNSNFQRSVLACVDNSESIMEQTPIQSILPQFKKMMWTIKFQFFAKRLLNATRSFMHKNMTIRQFKQIDDKAAIFHHSSKQSTHHLEFDKKMRKRDKINTFINSKNLRKTLTNQKNVKEKSKNFDQTQGISQWFNDFLEQNLLLQQFVKVFDKRFPVLEPTSMFKLVWDFISLFLILVYTIQVPLFITFNHQLQATIQWKIIFSIPIFIFCDILVAINTGCYDKGILIKKRLQLIQINLKKNIIPNLFIILTYAIFILVSYSDSTADESMYNRWRDLIPLTVWFKVSDFTTIVTKLQEHSIITRKNRNIIDLLHLILTIMYLSHLISCFWVIVAQIENEIGIKTWTKYTNFLDVRWYTLYIDAFYFTTVTMITVGYGDLIPVNEVEKTFCIIVMIFSCGVFAYSMSTIGSILESFNEDQVKKTMNMSIINAYMTRKNVSKQIKNSIREYLDYYWKEESERNQDAEEKIIGCLSDNLKKNLLMESKNVVLKKSAIFRTHFSNDVKEKIVPLIREYRCSPQEIICLQGEQDSCAIYFIEKGSVEILVNSSDNNAGMVRPIASLSVGESFGELCFFTGGCRSATVRSREFTTLLILERSEFLSLLVNYQEDYERFCTIRDSIKFYNNHLLINMECLSCQSKSHSVSHCPYTHYVANRDHLSKEFSTDPGQQRSYIKRQLNRKSNSRVNLNVVVDQAEEYQMQHDESIEYSNINALLKEGYSQAAAYNKQNYEEEKQMYQSEILQNANNKERHFPQGSIDRMIVESDSEDECDTTNPISSSKFIKQQPSQQSSYQVQTDVHQEDISDEDAGENPSEFGNMKKSRLSLPDEEQLQNRKKEFFSKNSATIIIPVAPPISVKTKLQRFVEQKATFPNVISPNHRKTLLMKYSKSHDFADVVDLLRQNSGSYNEKQMQKILLPSIFEAYQKKVSASVNLNQPTRSAKEQSNNIRDQQKRLTMMQQQQQQQQQYQHQQPIFFRRGGRFNRNNFSSPQKLDDIHQHRIPFNRMQPKNMQMSPNLMPLKKTQQAVGLNNLVIGPILDQHPFSEIDSTLLHSNNLNQIPDNFLEPSQGVDIGFDVMHNFKYYFPCNNVNYQMDLLNIPLRSRKSIILWNSYQSRTMILMGHSILTTKLPSIPTGNLKKLSTSKKTLMDTYKQKSMSSALNIIRNLNDNVDVCSPGEDLRKSKHFTNHLFKKATQKGDSLLNSQVIRSNQSQPLLTSQTLIQTRENQSPLGNEVLSRKMKYRFSTSKNIENRQDSQSYGKSLQTLNTKAIQSITTLGLHGTIKISRTPDESNEFVGLDISKNKERNTSHLEISFNQDDDFRQISNVMKEISRSGDKEELEGFRDVTCNISGFDGDIKMNESIQPDSSLFNCLTVDNGQPNVPPRKDSKTDFNLRDRRQLYTTMYDQDEEIDFANFSNQAIADYRRDRFESQLQPKSAHSIEDHIQESESKLKVDKRKNIPSSTTVNSNQQLHTFFS